MTTGAIKGNIGVRATQTGRGLFPKLKGESQNDAPCRFPLRATYHVASSNWSVSLAGLEHANKEASCANLPSRKRRIRAPAPEI